MSTDFTLSRSPDSPSRSEAMAPTLTPPFCGRLNRTMSYLHLFPLRGKVLSHPLNQGWPCDSHWQNVAEETQWDLQGLASKALATSTFTLLDKQKRAQVSSLRMSDKMEKEAQTSSHSSSSLADVREHSPTSYPPANPPTHCSHIGQLQVWQAEEPACWAQSKLQNQEPVSGCLLTLLCVRVVSDTIAS